MKTIGMIGIGMIGHGIASNLIRHGHPMVLLEHAGNQPLDQLVAAGASLQGSPASVAAAADVVVLCLTGTPEIEDVLRRQDGLLAGLKPGTIVIDCSTAMPASTVRMAEEIAAAGGRYLDAPMTRTPKEAAEGRLNLIVGGERALFEECKPMLQCFAENIVHAGPAGAGHTLKLLHNFVSLGFSAVLAEAAACADRAGIDAGVFVEVLAKGGGNSVVLDRLRPYIEARDASAFRFTIANALKDMTYYRSMAAEMDAAHGTAEAIRQLYAFADEQGGRHATVPEMITLLGNRAAMPPLPPLPPA